MSKAHQKRSARSTQSVRSQATKDRTPERPDASEEDPPNADLYEGYNDQDNGYTLGERMP